MQQNNFLGQNLGRYQIVDELGRGGMATVYKAWQPSLQRYVAIKALPPSPGNNEELGQRFRQEAIVAASLSHPNIVTVYEVLQQDGALFIVMEYIEGRPLSQVILEDGHLSMDRLVYILRQVADALDFAHRQHFVHRDIKPSNILITPDDRAVVTDFGIAKALEGSGATARLTATGTIMGTPAYMSPEQIAGLPVDFRTDLYSLGIVCYEMLGGQPPFAGNTTAALLYAQVNTPAPSIRQTNPGVSRSVEKALQRMLSKQAKERFPSARAFVDSLTGENSTRPSISAGQKQQMTPRGGMVYPPAAAPLDSRIPAGQVSTQKKQARRSAPIILSAVAIILALALTAIIAVTFWGDKTPGAFDQGIQAMAAQNYREAETAFAQVLSKEPNNVLANQGLGDALSSQERYADSIPYYKAALAGDDSLVNAHAGLAWAYFYTEQYQQAISEFARLIALRPAEVGGYEGKARSYYALKQYEEALPSLQTWAEMAPEEPEAHRLMGWVYYAQKLFPQAVDQFSRADGLSEPNGDIYNGLYSSYRSLGEFEQALTVAQRWVELEPDKAAAHVAVAWSLHGLGRYEEAVDAFGQALELEATATSYRGLGDSYYNLKQYDQALAAFEHLAELEPGNALALGSIGWTLNKLKRYDEAVVAFSRALEVAETPSLYQGLGDSYFQLQDYEQALEAFKRWAELEPARATAHNSVGWAYLLLKDCPNATQSFEKALALDPELRQAKDGAARCQAP